MSVLSDNIRHYRKLRNFSQDFIAEKLGYKSYTTIQKWETGVSEPSISKLYELAKLLDVDVNDLVNQGEQKSDEQNKDFPNRLKKAMELKKFNQSDLVEKTGITSGAISSYLSGSYMPKQNNIYLLAKALGVSEAYLLGWEEDYKEPTVVAAHATEDLTEEEIDEVMDFIEYVKSKRNK